MTDRKKLWTAGRRHETPPPHTRIHRWGGVPGRVFLALAVATIVACTKTPAEPDLPTLSLTTTTLPGAMVAVSYSQTLSASGGNGSYAWSISTGSLPTGLALGASSGAVSGTPTTAGLVTFTVRVVSGDGQAATRELSIDVAPPLPALTPPESCVGEPGTRTATFADANLADVVRMALGLGAADPFTCAGLGGLVSLVSDSAGIADLTGIQNLSGLDTLRLTGNAFSDLASLSGLTGLSDLDLSRNAIAGVDPLAALTGLDGLVLDNNAIADFDTLATLTGLTSLSIDNNSYSSIAAVGGMTGLLTLDISDSNVADLTPIANLTAVTLLDLDRNAFTSIGPLAALPALLRLDLDENAITDLSPLATVTTLTWLETNFLPTNDISSLGTLTALEHFESTGNSIVDVAAVESMVALRFLDLQGNGGLSDVQPLLDNSGLAAGDTVDLTGTPADCFDVATLEGRGVIVFSACTPPVLQPRISNTNRPVPSWGAYPLSQGPGRIETRDVALPASEQRRQVTSTSWSCSDPLLPCRNGASES